MNRQVQSTAREPTHRSYFGRWLGTKFRQTRHEEKIGKAPGEEDQKQRKPPNLAKNCSVQAKSGRAAVTEVIIPEKTEIPMLKVFRTRSARVAAWPASM